MTTTEHYHALEKMYLAAPINDFYKPQIEISTGKAKIKIELDEKMFHSAGAVHGSVYFKMLDDAAFFASNSYEQDVFVLTTSFTTYLTRPISAGQLEALGEVVNINKTQWIAQAVAYNDGKEVARGSGIFVRSKLKLTDALGYSI